MGRKVRYILGTQQLFWETVRDDDDAPITATSAGAVLVDKATDTVIYTLTVTKTAGRVEGTISSSAITIPGDYYIEWDIVYTKGTMTIITDIVAESPDSTYLATLIGRVRVWLGDIPENLNKRINQDNQIKMAIEEIVRTYMTSYTLTRNTDNLWEISPLPATNSDDEKLIVLYTAYFILTFWTDRIKSESTPMFKVDYDSSAIVLQTRVDTIVDEIKKLDDNFAMSVMSETDIEAWGQLSDRLEDALETWDD